MANLLRRNVKRRETAFLADEAGPSESGDNVAVLRDHLRSGLPVVRASVQRHISLAMRLYQAPDPIQRQYAGELCDLVWRDGNGVNLTDHGFIHL